MAKRKRKNKSIGAQLKYEVYGILLVTVSVIALSGEAAVGRSLSKLFALLLGGFYFVIPLVGIYAGMAVMIKRKWPSGWSNRKSGVLLLVLALTLLAAIKEVNQRTEFLGIPLTGDMIMQPANGLWQAFKSTPIFETGFNQRNLGGGFIGHAEYRILYSLFGYVGTYLILIVLFAIAGMLLTGRSYVDLARVLHKRGGRMLALLRHKLASGRARQPAAAVSAARKDGRGQDDLPMLMLDDDLDEDMDEPFEPVRAPKRRKTLFFSWLQAGREAKPSVAGQGRPDADGDEEIGAESPLVGLAAWSEKEESPAAGAAEPDDSTPPWEHASEPGAAAAPAIWPESLAPVEGTDPDGQPHAAPAAGGVQAAAAAGSAPQSGQPGVKPSKPYLLPPMSLLSKPQSGKSGPSDTTDSKRKLESTLESFGVKATVLNVVQGPAVTRYEVQPHTGVKVSRIVSLTDDIALALAAKDIRMEAPIPGKSAIGIEVPNTEVSMVTMREVMETTAFQQAPSKLSIAFGRDISGQPIVGNLARMPHLLVAGATGSGKSVCINGIITSILYKAAPDEVKFLMIDPKMVELNMYNGIPHLLAPVVTDPRRASLALKKIVVEMEKRYELFSKSGTRNIEGYNTLMKDNPAAVLPFIVVIVDELADLMMVAASDVEDSITRLAQMARAAGIHLIIATQRPSVDVITGVIKANIPSRIAFGVSSQVDSRTILDMVGAEKLLGRGDMLFLPVGMSKPIRVQGAFLSDQEVESVVHFAREQAEAEYKEDLVPEIEESGPEEDENLDELFDQAVQIVLEAKQASVSLLQRRMRVGYTRAARLIDQMEARGVVGPYEGSKPREVLMSMDQFQAGKISS